MLYPEFKMHHVKAICLGAIQFWMSILICELLSLFINKLFEPRSNHNSKNQQKARWKEFKENMNTHSMQEHKNHRRPN